MANKSKKTFTIEHDTFREFIEKSADGLLVVDLQGVVRFTNPAVEFIFEKSSDDIVGQKFDFHILARHDALGGKSLDDLSLKYVLLLAKTSKTTELEIALEGNLTRLVEMRAIEIHWEAKAAYLVVFHDITSLMRLQRLKAEIFERERVSKLKDEFISTVSHELRTPLAIVKCAIENMKDGVAGALSEKQEKVVKIASANVDRLTKLIDDILDLSRLEAGSVLINVRDFPMDELVGETLRRFALIAKEQNVELDSAINANLPQVSGDADKITQVLDNLLSNALRFAQAKILVKVQTLTDFVKTSDMTLKNCTRFQDFIDRREDALIVSVVDDGPGIPEEKIEFLFNKFVQIDRPSGGAGYKGTGLGLAISREIIDLHQGRIWADSEFGTGSRFHFLLPYKSAQANLSVDQTSLQSE
jgi:PAS domain S-box-containing protein